MSKLCPSGMGWRRDSPDFRDYTPERPPARDAFDQLAESSQRRPAKVDLREFFRPVEDQGNQSCSAACACLGLVEYFRQRAHGHTDRASRLFLYGTSRKLMGAEGDAGAALRTTLKALVRFGAPPATFWPQEGSDVDDRLLDPLLYGFASDYRSIRYVRLDPPNMRGSDTLEAVKSHLAAGFPCVFGFPVPSSISSSAYVPYRPTFDSVVGCQAVVAVGYDDGKRAATKGALIIRNSWGSAWGENGYGWLPYTYVENQLAVDFWTLLEKQWLESGEFLRPSVPPRVHTVPTAIR